MSLLNQNSSILNDDSYRRLTLVSPVASKIEGLRLMAVDKDSLIKEIVCFYENAIIESKKEIEVLRARLITQNESSRTNS